MTVDNNSNKCSGSPTTATPGSTCTPFQDRIYVTWTEFAPNGTAFIYEAYSSDYGEHFSQRHLVSTNSPLCPSAGGAGPCNANQFSQPFVGPDGVLYVIFNNFNNSVQAGDNRNQILLARSLDGGNTFQPLVKVADFYDLPDCATYQQGHDFGRACVPEKAATANSIFRATNYGSGEVNPTNPNQVVVAFGSYINKHSNESNGCAPTGFSPVTGQNLFTGVKTPGACNNDILVSVSNDGGQTFTGRRRIRASCRAPTRSLGRRLPTSSGSGSPSRRTGSLRPRTTTASTATTRRPETRTSACLDPATLPATRSGTSSG